MKRLIRNSTTKFSTYPVSSVELKQVVGSHIYIAKQDEREQIAEELFKFIDDAYDGEGGYKSFKDVDHFISDSYLWYITYEGEQPEDLADFDVKKVFVVSVFRQNHGMKMVGMARRVIGKSERDKERNAILRRNANSALFEHIKFLKNNKKGWAEVSGRLESYFKQVYNFSDIIDPYELQVAKIFDGLIVDIDEFHYLRPLRKGMIPVTKIAYGNIVWTTKERRRIEKYYEEDSVIDWSE